MHSRTLRILTVFFITLVVVGTLASTPLTVSAQQPYDSFAIETTPTNPAPGQSVVVQVKSLSSDIAHADIAWYEGSTLLKRGNGLSQITVTAPKNGTSMKITSIIRASDGKSSTQTVTIRSGEVDMSWEALTYTPPLYQGRSIYTSQSNIKIVALPNLRDNNGRLISPDDLVYKWKKDSTVLGSLSGYGKQSLTLKGDIASRPFTITVDVASRDNSIKGQGFMNVDAVDPEVLLYEEDPLYGVLYNRAVGEQFSLKNETKLTAEPYYFSTTNKSDSALRYTWSINRLEQNDIRGTNLILRPKGDVEGVSLISLRIDNLREILQSSSAEIGAYFSKKQQEELPLFQ